MKKLALLMAMVLMAVSFTGCGEKRQAVNEDGVIPIDWVGQCDSPVDNDSPLIEALNEEFGVKLNFVYFDRSKKDELMNIRFASGEIPDVFSINKDSRYRELIKQGILAEIPEDFIKKEAPEIYNYTLQNNKENLWDVAKEDGKLYGIPGMNYNGKHHYVPIWRDDWMKNVGVDKIPETVEEAEELIYKFTFEDPDRNGKNDTYGMSTNGIKAILNAYGAAPLSFFWMKYDGEIVMSAVIPEMKEALTLLNKWYKDGVIDPEFITGENNGQHFATPATFINGRIGFSNPGLPYHVCPGFDENNTGMASNYKSFKEVQGENATFTYGKPLVGPHGKSGAEHWGLFSGAYAVIGRNVEPGSEKMKKILQILNKQNSDFDTYITYQYGREGIDYEKNGDSYVKLIEPRERQKLGLGANGVQLINVNFDFYEKTLLPNQLEFYEQWGNNVPIENYSQAVWGSLPSDEIYRATIEGNIEENYYAFITGARDISEFDKWIEELNKAGLKQLTKEANEWYVEKYGSVE